MDEIKVIRLNPVDLPSEISWSVSARQHISPKDFVVYMDDKENIMYVNESVPEKDIAGFIKIVTFSGQLVCDYDCGLGDYADFVCDRYGYHTYKELINSHKWRMEQKAKKEAKEKVQRAIPAIEQLIKAGLYNEYMVHEAYSIGSDIEGKTPKNICGFWTLYPYFLGYLAGKGELKEEYTPEEIGGISDYCTEVKEMMCYIDIHEMPRIYGYLKEMYFSEEREV